MLYSPTSKDTAQEEARGSERPSLSPQLPTHEMTHDPGKSSPGPQPPACDEAQDSAERPSLGPQLPTHEEAHDFLERPPHSPQLPMHEEARISEKSSSHGLQPPPEHASVKGPPTAKRKARPVLVNRKREERRRLENERRLAGQRLEYERKVEARRKAEEAAAVARAQCVKPECREDAEGGSSTVGIKMDDDQKVHNDGDAETVGAPGPRVLEHDTGATCLAIPNDEHSESHLIMMEPVSYSFLSP